MNFDVIPASGNPGCATPLGNRLRGGDLNFDVIPAQAGIQAPPLLWAPAFAGAT